MGMRSVEEILLHEAGVPADLLAKAHERLKDHQDLGDALIELGHQCCGLGSHSSRLLRPSL